MSTSFSPYVMSVKTSTPIRSIADGSKVGGATTRTCAPIVPKRWMLERATRLCRMSPQIATVSPSSLPLRRRIDRASSSAWVGCSCVPSPALMTEQLTLSASSLVAPDWAWRMTRKSGFIAFRVIAVSSSVSPFFTELEPTDMLSTSAPSRLPASSNEVLVRVESSKNRFMTVRPLSSRLRLSGRRFCSTYRSERSSTAVISAALHPFDPQYMPTSPDDAVGQGGFPGYVR